MAPKSAVSAMGRRGFRGLEKKPGLAKFLRTFLVVYIFTSLGYSAALFYYFPRPSALVYEVATSLIGLLLPFFVLGEWAWTILGIRGELERQVASLHALPPRELELRLASLRAQLESEAQPIVGIIVAFILGALLEPLKTLLASITDVYISLSSSDRVLALPVVATGLSVVAWWILQLRKDRLGKHIEKQALELTLGSKDKIGGDAA